MITLKDYAKQHNVTYEAIRSQVNRYREQLGDHIIQEGRQQFLDDYAVEFLDERRQKSPVVIYQQSKDELIDQLEQENKLLLSELAASNKMNVELMQYKLANEEQRRALEDAQTAQARRELELNRREGLMEQQIIEAVQKASTAVRSTVEEEKDKEIKEIRAKAEEELRDEKAAHDRDNTDKDKEIGELRSLRDANNAAIERLRAMLNTEKTRRLSWRERFFGRKESNHENQN